MISMFISRVVDTLSNPTLIDALNLIVTLSGVTVAICSLRENTRQARLRGTLDTIHKMTNTPEYVKSRSDIENALRDARKNGLSVSPIVYRSQELMDSVICVLNAREFISANVLVGSLDFELTKRLAKSDFISDYVNLKDLIGDIRRNSRRPMFCADFETLVEKFRTTDLSIKQRVFTHVTRKLRMLTKSFKTIDPSEYNPKLVGFGPYEVPSNLSTYDDVLDAIYDRVIKEIVSDTTLPKTDYATPRDFSSYIDGEPAVDPIFFVPDRILDIGDDRLIGKLAKIAISERRKRLNKHLPF